MAQCNSLKRLPDNLEVISKELSFLGTLCETQFRIFLLNKKFRFVIFCRISYLSNLQHIYILFLIVRCHGGRGTPDTNQAIAVANLVFSC